MPRQSYGGLALAVIAASVGVVGVLVSVGYLDPYVLASIPLLALGTYTLVFSAVARDRGYYALWGSIIAGLGAALALVTVTGSLLLNFSVLLIALALLGALLTLKRGR